MEPQVGTAGDDTLVGTNSADTLSGRDGNDILYGWSDADLAYGGLGHDTIFGGSEDDTLYGGAGNDELQTGPGLDFAYAGAGDDLIYLGYPRGGVSAAEAYGGTGNDTVDVLDVTGGIAEGGTGTDRLDFTFSGRTFNDGVTIDFLAGTATSLAGFSLGFSGFEHLTTRLAGGNDVVSGSDNADDIHVGGGTNLADALGGDDIVTYFVGGPSTLEGGAGQDRLVVQTAQSSLYFIVDTFDGSVDDGQLAQISGFEQFEVWGSLGNDIVRTGEDDDLLKLSWGEDTGLGGGGDDRLIGGHDNDSLDGGEGDDRLNGGSGSDILTGGAGSDGFIFRVVSGMTDIATDFISGEDDIRLARVDASQSAGALDPARFSDGAPVGSAAQIVRLYDSLADETALWWYDAGSASLSPLQLARFGGDVSILATDITLI